jgi:hypothetical protein
MPLSLTERAALLAVANESRFASVPPARTCAPEGVSCAFSLRPTA